MNDGLHHIYLWNSSELAEGLRLLLTKKALYKAEFPLTDPPNIEDDDDLDKLDVWFQINAQAHSLQITPEHWRAEITKQLLTGCGPGIVRLHISGTIMFVVVLQSTSRYLFILNRVGDTLRVPIENLFAYTRPNILRSYQTSRIEEIISAIALPETRKKEINRVLAEYQRKDEDLRGIWTLKYSPEIGIWKRLLLSGFAKDVTIICGLITLNILVFAYSWKFFAAAVYANSLNPGWFITWCLILFSAVPLQMLFNFRLGLLGIHFSEIFKSVFFSELLKIAKEKIKALSMGGFLSIAIDAEIIESNIIQGAVILAVAMIEILTYGSILLFSKNLWILGIALFVWVGFYAIKNRSFFYAYKTWVEMRSQMTNELLEKVQGFRTIRIQNDLRKVTREEDLSLVNYHFNSLNLDNRKLTITTFGERGWPILGLLILIALISQSEFPINDMMIGMGLLLLTGSSLSRLDSSLKYLVGALVSWLKIAPYLESTKPILSHSRIYVDDEPQKTNQKSGDLLSVKNLDFKYPDRQRLILEKLNMTVAHNEHVILTGASGGGKSTLAKLINLTLTPTSGKIFLKGLDHVSWSEQQWRKKIVYVPQFHNNHIFNGTLLFNLLMARRWPPTLDDRDAAEAICGALGLSSLLGRMPQGMSQMLGEAGWRISHGEKSRIFIARGILQYPELLILDESLAAIDPETTEKVFDAITSFTKTCIIIAHP